MKVGKREKGTNRDNDRKPGNDLINPGGNKKANIGGASKDAGQSGGGKELLGKIKKKSLFS